MSGTTLQCVVRSREGSETRKTAEVTGEGKSYLASLSKQLSAMQAEVNAVLTEMVDKERGQGARNGARQRGESENEGRGRC